jgi:hypothetical protein
MSARWRHARAVLVALVVAVSALALPAAGQAKLVIIGNAEEVRQMEQRLRRLCLDREVAVFEEQRGHWVVAIGDPPDGGDRRTPAGCKVIAELVLNDAHTVWIHNDRALQFPRTVAFDSKGAGNGEGSSSVVGWNPTDTDSTYRARAVFGGEIPLPLDIALAHELIRASRMITGTRATGLGGRPDKAAEDQWVVESGDVNENDIRLEQDRATGKAIGLRTTNWRRINRRKPRRVSALPTRPTPAPGPARRPIAGIPG